MESGTGRGSQTRLGCLILAVVITAVVVLLIQGSRRPVAVDTLYVCARNLKTIGTAVQMYAYVNDGWYPYYAMTVPVNGREISTNWRVALTEYVGGEFGSLTEQLREPDYTGTHLLARGFEKVFSDPFLNPERHLYYAGSKAMFLERPIEKGNPKVTRGPLHQDWARFPGTTAIVGPPRPDEPGRFPYFVTGANQQYVEFRHEGWANTLFLDARVQFWEQGNSELLFLENYWNTMKLP